MIARLFAYTDRDYGCELSSRPPSVPRVCTRVCISIIWGLLWWWGCRSLEVSGTITRRPFYRYIADNSQLLCHPSSESPPTDRTIDTVRAVFWVLRARTEPPRLVSPRRAARKWPRTGVVKQWRSQLLSSMANRSIERRNC